MGSVGPPAAASRRSRCHRHLHAPPDCAEGPRQGVGRSMSGPLGVAIVGCGAVGRKRAAALTGGRLIACADVSRDRAEALAGTTPGAIAVDRWQDVVSCAEV